MLNDVLSDGVTRLRNGCMAKLTKVSLINSKAVRNVMSVLKDEGYIESFQASDDKRSLEVFLRYHNKQPVLRMIRRISKPGCRIYSGVEFPRLKNTFGFFVVSTSKGVMAGYKAKKLGIGGEILLEVY